MAYQFTFTKRFQKHFKNLTAQEKKAASQQIAAFIRKSHAPIPSHKAYSGDQRFI